MANIDQAMIMAAGMGKRMLPLTENLPKPMIEIRGKTLITHILEKLYFEGIKKIVINVHYLSELIIQHVKSLPFYHDIEVIFSHEDELLESGGGIVKALPFFNNKPFYRINSDIYWEDESLLYYINKNWENNNCDALLLAIEKNKFFGYDGKGDFDIISDKYVKILANELAYAFSGIGVFCPKLFEKLEIKKFTLFGDFIFKEKKNSENILHNINALKYENRIFHIGTVENLKEADKLLKLEF
ncbi:MAG: nucleotidyltransferase family protein [Alphaproteobacteria bacterium]